MYLCSTYLSLTSFHPFSSSFFRAASLIFLSSSLLLYARKVTMQFENLPLLHIGWGVQSINLLYTFKLCTKKLSSFEEEYDYICINNGDSGDDDDDDEVDNEL